MKTQQKKWYRRWFSNGSSMAYGLRYRVIACLGNLLLYSLLNIFYIRLLKGIWIPWNISLQDIYNEPLSSQLQYPLNIFHFPMYIIILALIMALLCVVPILIAQLYNTWYSLGFVCASLLLGRNPVFSLCLLISCIIVGFDLMRFKSKFVAAVLCLLPELLYWIIFGDIGQEQDALRWAVLRASWGLAFLFSVALVGLIIAAGHFLSYRPGIMMPVFGVLVAGTVLLFHYSIGMTERDFQDNVYRWRPEMVVKTWQKETFSNSNRANSIAELLEKDMSILLKNHPHRNPQSTKDVLRLKWRFAFGSSLLTPVALGDSENVSEAQKAALSFKLGWTNAITHISEFKKTYPKDKRVADTLYYMGLLFDMKADIHALREDDILVFYYDTPSERSESIWQELLENFPQSQVSLEARWRLARLRAVRKPKSSTDSFNFTGSLSLLQEAQDICTKLVKKRQEITNKNSYRPEWMGDIFTPPASTLTNDQLVSLQVRISRLSMLIGKENRSGHRQHDERLAEFVSLDSHQPDYMQRLTALKSGIPQDDPLIDNIELGQALLIKEPDSKIEKLTELVRLYENRDGGIEARLELALGLLEKRNRSEHQGDRALLLSRCREHLQKITEQKNYLAQYAQALLTNNPIE